MGSTEHAPSILEGPLCKSEEGSITEGQYHKCKIALQALLAAVDVIHIKDPQKAIQIARKQMSNSLMCITRKETLCEGRLDPEACCQRNLSDEMFHKAFDYLGARKQKEDE